MSYHGAPMTPPRLAPFWTAIRDRLDTATMQTVLGGAGRVYRAMDDYAEPEGAEAAAWGRAVVVPVTRMWDVRDVAGRERVVPWLVRVEVHRPADDYDPLVTLEAAHAEAFARLHGWIPGAIADAAGTVRARVRLAVWRETQPQPLPRYEDGLWWLSAEYRAVVESPDAGVI